LTGSRLSIIAWRSGWYFASPGGMATPLIEQRVVPTWKK